MELNKAWEREKRIKKAFMQDQYECPVCDGDLDVFVEKVDDFGVKEEARCAKCAKLIRIEDHILH